MMQIVQELCKRPGLNRTGFDMPTIYVPTLNQKVLRNFILSIDFSGVAGFYTLHGFFFSNVFSISSEPTLKWCRRPYST
jgi:hypothetical protein